MNGEAALPQTERSAPALKPCGSCSMCCKVFRVVEFDKPAGQWCRHTLHGKGCAIHESRPDVCRAFFCHWTRNPALDETWRPDHSKVVLYTEAGGRRLVAVVDPGAPGAWTKPPVYQQLKRWAAAAAGSDHQVVVFHGMNATVILPDRDVPVGEVAIGDEILVKRHNGALVVEVRRAGGGDERQAP
jgi:hypothetical protein